MLAKFHRPSLPGSAQSSKTGTDRPTEFAIAICPLVNTKCHKNRSLQLEFDRKIGELQFISAVPNQSVVCKVSIVLIDI